MVLQLLESRDVWCKVLDKPGVHLFPLTRKLIAYKRVLDAPQSASGCVPCGCAMHAPRAPAHFLHRPTVARPSSVQGNVWHPCMCAVGLESSSPISHTSAPQLSCLSDARRRHRVFQLCSSSLPARKQQAGLLAPRKQLCVIIVRRQRPVSTTWGTTMRGRWCLSPRSPLSRRAWVRPAAPPCDLFQPSHALNGTSDML